MDYYMHRGFHAQLESHNFSLSLSDQLYESSTKHNLHKILLRAITLVDVKLCKMEKSTHFTRYEKKNSHISSCKLVYKCKLI